jgi:hypothetical protein
MSAVHRFTLILADIEDFDEEMSDRVYEAGCGDAALSSCEGVVTLDFNREAPSRDEAVSSAIADVAKAGYSVLRVDPCDR